MKKVKEYVYSDKKRLLLKTPLSEKILIDDGADAFSLLPYHEPRFWRAGSCSAELQYYFFEGNYCSLSVMCRTGKGYYIAHSIWHGNKLVDDTTFVAARNMDFKDKISIDVCGDFFNFPASAFVPPEVAQTIIMDFCVDGSKSQSINWCQHPLPLKFDEVYGSRY